MEDDTGANANQEIAESEEANKEDTKVRVKPVDRLVRVKHNQQSRRHP
jgi:hypothetical protein